MTGVPRLHTPTGMTGAPRPHTPTDLAWAFNEWMRRYIEDPTKFEVEFETVIKFLGEMPKEEKAYGKECYAYLARLIEEKEAAQLAAAEV